MLGLATGGSDLVPPSMTWKILLPAALIAIAAFFVLQPKADDCEKQPSASPVTQWSACLFTNPRQ